MVLYSYKIDFGGTKLNLRTHKWKWISSVIVLLGLVSSIVFYRNEQAYAEAIKNAKAAVELEDYDLAYQSISEKKPKTADELLFKKIKSNFPN